MLLSRGLLGVGQNWVPSATVPEPHPSDDFSLCRTFLMHTRLCHSLLLYSLYVRSFQLSILTTSNSSSLRLDPLLSVDILTHIIKKISDVKWELPCLANDNTTNLVCHRLCLLTSHNAKSVPSGQGQPPHPFSHTKDFSPAITPCPPRQQHLLFYWLILILTLYFLLLINLPGVGPHHAAVLRSLSFFA